ncbi:MAG: ribonuclease III [Myxococcales bacterium]|nr:ribonuclease III [Myxococcales bacterium]MCB9643096.1 ribonuclease III [Myxococcales bacterium]
MHPSHPSSPSQPEASHNQEANTEPNDAYLEAPEDLSPKEAQDDPQRKPLPLEEILNYRFRDLQWLEQALTHRSFCHEAKPETIPSYERLEFLGDAVLELSISHYLWAHYPTTPEGGLTAFRASLVKRETLAEIARQIDVGQFVRLGRGEKRRGGDARESILADTVEALLGAVYIDGGFAQAQRVCRALFADAFSKLDPSRLTNFKNQLQELAACLQLNPPQYNFLQMEGPEHTPTFFMEAVLDPTRRAVGQGNTKKDASQQAAKLLLEQLKQESQPRNNLKQKVSNPSIDVTTRPPKKK